MFLFNKNSSIIAKLSADIQLGTSKIHGTGVFSKKHFRKGELIETAPLLRGSAADYEMLSHTSLHDYYFMLKDKDAPMAIGLGFASWYNHYCPANAIYLINNKNNTIQIKARCNIEAGTEITINYHGEPDDDSPIQFTPERLLA